MARQLAESFRNDLLLNSNVIEDYLSQVAVVHLIELYAIKFATGHEPQGSS
jgi:hypothetical protein